MTAQPGAPVRHGAVSGTVPAMTQRVNPRRPMTQKTVRVPDPLWAAAQLKADERGDVLAVVIRKALERYVARG